jgi:glycosyltransferase involved in cell wall biosynthesis
VDDAARPDSARGGGPRGDGPQGDGLRDDRPAGGDARVTHVSSVHRWTDNRIHYRECATLVEHGYRVTLVAVDTPVPGPKTAVRVIACPPVPRLRRMAFGSVRAVRTALKTNASIYHLHDPELVWAVPYLRLRGKKVVWDAHEDLPLDVQSKAYLRPVGRRVAQVAARAILRVAALANQVVAATEPIAARFPPAKTTVVHNYPPLRLAEDSASPVTARPQAAVYVGLMAQRRGAFVMADAARSPLFPASWVLRAAGPMISPGFEAELAARPGWADVDYLGVVPPEEARDLMLNARVGLLLLQDTPAHRGGALPTKLFEYFAAGLPVIASDFEHWRPIIRDHDCGLLVDPSSPSEVAAAIARYASDDQLALRHSANARRLAVEQLNWTAEGQALLGVYARL